jgi:branched-chain amino acid transport system substrate-binding protein
MVIDSYGLTTIEGAYKMMFRMKSKTTWLIVLTVLLGVALMAGGCSSGAQSGSGAGTIKIGWVAPLTGPCAADGQQMLNGAKLAAKKINAAGGISGKQIELVPQDDKSDPKEAANIATKFSADSSLVAVLGNYNSSCVLAEAPIMDQAQLPMVHVGTSPVFTTQDNPYLFRISMTDAFQGSFVTQWMYGEGQNDVAILYENDDYGNGLKDTVKNEMGSLGGKVAGTWSYELGSTKDYTPLLTSVKSSGANVLFIGGLYTEGALICEQMQQLGMNLPVYGTDGLYETDLIKLGGAAVEGVRVSGLFLPNDTNPKVASFVSAYKAAYNDTPGTYAALDYDAMDLLAQTITSVGTDHSKIQAYLAGMTTPFAGVTGNLTFDQHHDAQRPGVNKLVVKNGQWVLYQKQ